MRSKRALSPYPSKSTHRTERTPSSKDDIIEDMPIRLRSDIIIVWQTSTGNQLRPRRATERAFLHGQRTEPNSGWNHALFGGQRILASLMPLLRIFGLIGQMIMAIRLTVTIHRLNGWRLSHRYFLLTFEKTDYILVSASIISVERGQVTPLRRNLRT